MPRVLSVSEVRDQLYWAAGGRDAGGAGDRTIGQLGSLFHRMFASLTGSNPDVNLVAPLQLADASLRSWQRALTNHAYRKFVAPGLSDNHAALQTHTQEVLGYWTATQELCAWLAAVVFEQYALDQTLEEIRERIFKGSEVELSAEFKDPSWSSTITVQGRADSILAQHATGVCCLVELKLGRTAPEADLLQACLYHLLLNRGPTSRLALIAFEPLRHEYLFEAHQLKEAQTQLKALIWRLAGSEAASVAPSDPRPAGLEGLSAKLVDAFAEFGSPLEMEGTPVIGPTFIRFFAVTQHGVRVRGLAGLADSVWSRIGTEQQPHITQERGRIAIDVERPDRQQVLFSEYRNRLPVRNKVGVSRFPVGIAVDGSVRFADLAEPESAHCLVAGTNGSGKSEWLRATLACLLAANEPTTLRLVLIDPKRTAFGAFQDSPYLWHALIYADGVLEALDALVDEMERRYVTLTSTDANNLAEYNARAGSALPRIVCVCDEYADLVLGDRKRRQELEIRVSRLSAKARAAGIHLIFATQRPSRDIVKGVIDSNFTARVALRVVRSLESRIIVGNAGAETLLGKGDLLYKDIGTPVRLQGLFVHRSELDALMR